jgi:Reverse transcriptase (RNA-dependent DNA polymerase).
LPLIDDQVDSLQGARIFTTLLLLKNRFFHVELEEDSRKYTAFVVPNGEYEFLRVPFGLCNSPSVFQKYINAVFRDLIAAGMVLTYMDGLVIPSMTIEEGIERLRIALDVASQHGLLLNWKKCQFFAKSDGIFRVQHWKR